ncbi:MAG: GTPase HflX [Denitrovibrio sp.]|nr:MAG: GTPase HflX [Denitrovibrio sp.]
MLKNAECIKTIQSKDTKILYGNKDGLKPQQIQRLEKLYTRKAGVADVVQPELARTICELSNELNRQIGVLVDRKGNVYYVIVGDTSEVFIPRLDRFPLVPGSLRGLRLVHTHLSGEDITDDDLTDLALLRLDSVTALYFNDKGIPDGMKTAHLLPPESDQYYDFLIDRDPHRQTVNYLDFITELEGEISSKTKRLHQVDVGNHALLLGCYKSRAQGNENMTELAELARSANMHVSETVLQIKDKMHAKYVVGPGKLKEVVIKSMQNGVEFLVFDNPLSPAQAKAIADFTDLKIIDRPQLILDIFAKRAKTNDGKIRVELAQLKYLLPRLYQRDDSLSRLTGGIGGRGPGNTKLEIDRRRINDRIAMLSGKLKKIERNRQTMRQKRNRNELPIVSIIGYTNAGKSTLLNSLTQSGVYADNLMFATLDTSSKRIRFPQEKDVIITDTVGFIRDLPENLKGAFKSTLEELQDADMLLHVVDVAAEGFDSRVHSVETVLQELELSDRETILVINKTDLLADYELDYIKTGVMPEGAEPDLYDRAHEIVELTERYNQVCLVSAIDRKTFRELLEMIRMTLFVQGALSDTMGIEDYFGSRNVD